MRKRCGGDHGPVVDVIGPRLHDPMDAVRALRLSYGSHGGESVVVLVCDDERRVVLAVEFEGAPAEAAADVLECMAPAIPPSSSVVVGLFRPGRSPVLEPWDVEAVHDMAALCEEEAITVLDVVVVGDLDWCSVPDVGEGWSRG